MCVCIYTHIYTQVLYVYMCVCVYVCMDECVRVFIYMCSYSYIDLSIITWHCWHFGTIIFPWFLASNQRVKNDVIITIINFLNRVSISEVGKSEISLHVIFQKLECFLYRVPSLLFISQIFNLIIEMWQKMSLQSFHGNFSNYRK